MIQIGTNIFVYYSQMLSTLWYNEYPYFNWPTILFYLKYDIVHTRLSYYNVTTRLVDLVGLCWFLKELMEKIC